MSKSQAHPQEIFLSASDGSPGSLERPCHVPSVVLTSLCPHVARLFWGCCIWALSNHPGSSTTRLSECKPVRWFFNFLLWKILNRWLSGQGRLMKLHGPSSTFNNEWLRTGLVLTCAPPPQASISFDNRYFGVCSERWSVDINRCCLPFRLCLTLLYRELRWAWQHQECVRPHKNQSDVFCSLPLTKTSTEQKLITEPRISFKVERKGNRLEF